MNSKMTQYFVINATNLQQIQIRKMQMQMTKLEENRKALDIDSLL